MISNGQKRKASLWIVSIAGIVSLFASTSLVVPLRSSTHATQDAGERERAPVPRGKEPNDVVATVVAMSRDPWENVGYPFEILLFRVDKVLGEAKIERYVRADFERISVFTDSEESRVYRQLLSSLREPKTWKIHLRPPRGSADCWTIPPPPIPGDLMSSGNPVIVSVGGASGYPDVNKIPCYIIDQRNIEEVVPADKAK